MALFRRPGARSAAAQLPPVMRSLHSLIEVLAKFPATVLVTDRLGGIVYRNEAAIDPAQRTPAPPGETALVQLRDVLKETVRTAPSFPHSRDFQIGGGTDPVAAVLYLGRVADGFVATWENVSGQRRTASVVARLADELAAASTSLAELGQHLTSTGAHASQRAQAVSQGSGEMAASIREIATRVSSASLSTDAAVDSAENASSSMA